jgi:hypothetical protein
MLPINVTTVNAKLSQMLATGTDSGVPFARSNGSFTAMLKAGEKIPKQHRSRNATSRATLGDELIESAVTPTTDDQSSKHISDSLGP